MKIKEPSAPKIPGDSFGHDISLFQTEKSILKWLFSPSIVSKRPFRLLFLNSGQKNLKAKPSMSFTKGYKVFLTDQGFSDQSV